MDSFLNASCRVALAGLVHGLGRLARRADFEKHAAPSGGSGAYSVIEAAAPDLKKEAWPFAPQGASAKAEETLFGAAANEELPRSFLEAVVAAGGRIASGFQREEFDKASRIGQHHLRTRLRSLFEEVSLGVAQRRDFSFDTLRKAHSLKPLTPASLFPVELNAAEPKTDAQAEHEYAALRDAFEAALAPGDGSIPEAYRRNWPLWLDAFDTAWFTFMHAVPFDTAYGVKPDVSLYDQTKTAAALSTALWRWQEAQGAEDAAAADRLKSGAEDAVEKFLLIQGDFFGIQDFIFSEGAETNKNSAKVLRGRSFYVSLICELAALKVLDALELPSTSLIINAAGKFLIVAANTPETLDKLEAVRRELDDWFVRNTFAACGIGIVSTKASSEDFIAKRYGELTDRLFADMERAKFQRFDLPKRTEVVLDADFSHGVCRWQSKLPADGRADGSSSALSRDQILIGRALTQFQHLLILRRVEGIPAEDGLRICELPVFGLHVAFSADPRHLRSFDALVESGRLLRCWDFSLPESEDEVLWNGFARRAINGFIPRYDEQDLTGPWADDEDAFPGAPKTFEALSHADQRDGRGVPALMTLKGDVDNLGQIFRRGLVHEDKNPGKRRTLTFAKTAELSRKMNGFFSTWLPLVCARGFKNVYTVFAGGDDFFMIGPWHEMQRLARHLEADFRRYVAENPEIHFSAGLVMTKPAVPARTLSRLAEESLDAAKSAGKNRLSLYGSLIEWKDVARLVELEDFLARAVEDYGATTSYLYGLFTILDMAADHANPASSIWRSRLYYNTVRLFERDAKRRGVDVGRARDEFLQTLVQAISQNEGAFRIPLTNVFYSIREA